jgi:hypothetical protein
MLRTTLKPIRDGLLWAFACFFLIACQDNFKTVGLVVDAAHSSVALSATSAFQNDVITVSITLKDKESNGVPGIRPSISVPAGATASTCSVTNAAGISTCTFTSSTANTYHVTVTSPVSLISANVIYYQIPATLAFGAASGGQQPADITSMNNFGSDVKVRVKDIYSSNLTAPAPPGLTVTMNVSGTDSTAQLYMGGVPCAVGGCTAAVDATGLATFTNMTSDKIGTYTLTASLGTITKASTSYIVNLGPASQIAFTTQPNNTTGTGSVDRDVRFSTAPVVQIQDAGGNTVSNHATDSNVSVALSLIGCPTADIISDRAIATLGVARFSEAHTRFMTLAASVTGCKLRATATLSGPGAVHVDSNAFDINVPGAAAKLNFGSVPSTGITNTSMELYVEVTDTNGVRVTTDNSTSITIQKSPLSTGTGFLMGTITKTVESGVAEFDDIYFDHSGDYILSAVSAPVAYAPLPTNTITISNNGTATKLAMSNQPDDTTVNLAFPSTVRVRLRDVNGDIVSSLAAGVPITASLSSGTGALGGTKTRNTNSYGVAIFDDLTVDTVGSNKRLNFTSPGLTSVTSASFDVYAAAAARRLRFVTEPNHTSIHNNAASFQNNGLDVAVEIVDERGCRVNDSVSTIKLECYYSNAWNSPGTCDPHILVNAGANVTASSGLATFNGVNAFVDTADSEVVLRATVTGGPALGINGARSKENLEVQ